MEWGLYQLELQNIRAPLVTGRGIRKRPLSWRKYETEGVQHVFAVLDEEPDDEIGVQELR